jgi:bacteriophage Mu gam like protein
MSLLSVFKKNSEIGNDEIPNVIFKADESLICDLLEDIEAQDNELISGNSLDNPEQMTREEAEYFTKKYIEAANEIKEAEEVAKQYMEQQQEKVNNWLEKIKKNNQFLLDIYGGALEMYTKAQLEETGKKSIKLIQGTLSFRKSRDKYEYDEDVLRKSLTDNHIDTFFEEVEPKIKKAELKKTATVKNNKLYINDTLIDGVTITPQEDVFSIK